VPTGILTGVNIGLKEGMRKDVLGRAWLYWVVFMYCFWWWFGSLIIRILLLIVLSKKKPKYSLFAIFLI